MTVNAYLHYPEPTVVLEMPLLEATKLLLCLDRNKFPTIDAELSKVLDQAHVVYYE